MIDTYIDSGVLIEAYRVAGPSGPAAAAILGDPNRIFVTSEVVHLETLPKPTYYHRADEVAFYLGYFAAARLVTISTRLIQLAMQQAEKFGLNGMDALHIAAAEIGGAVKFVTTERATSPLLRVDTVRVVSLHP